MAVPYHFLPELLPLIFADLSLQDLKSIRLTCRLFAAAASRLLLKRAYITPLTHVLDRFTAITAHPVFSRTVTEIIYIGSVYDARLVTDRASFRAHVEEKVKSRLPFMGGENTRRGGRLLNSRAVTRSYDNYYKHVRDQERVKTSGADLACLVAGLPRLRKLKVVEVTDDAPPSGLYIPGCEGDMLLGPCRWDDYAVRDEARRHGWVVLMRALAQAGVDVEEVRSRAAATGELITGMPASIFGGQLFTSRLGNARDAFRSVKKVELYLRLSPEQDYNIINQGGLATILAAAEGLEDLTLGIERTGFWYQEVPLSPLIGKDTTWPRLQTLFLWGPEFTETYFLAFLRRHVDSLTHLRLHTVEMTEGSLVTMTERMADFMKLEDFTIECAEDPQHDDLDGYADINYQVGDFVVGRIPNPWPEHFRLKEEGNNDLWGIDGSFVLFIGV